MVKYNISASKSVRILTQSFLTSESDGTAYCRVLAMSQSDAFRF